MRCVVRARKERAQANWMTDDPVYALPGKGVALRSGVGTATALARRLFNREEELGDRTRTRSKKFARAA